MKNIKIFFNTTYILSVVGSLVLSYVFIFMIFEPIVKSDFWVIFGTYMWFFILVFLIFGRLTPLILKIDQEKKITFYGIPWKYVLIRAQIDDVIIEPTGIIFLPKPEYMSKYKFVMNYASYEYKGYKVIKFANYKAIGALIDALKPVSDFIYLDKVSLKWRKYFEEKMYGGNE